MWCALFQGLNFMKDTKALELSQDKPARRTLQSRTVFTGPALL